MISSLRDHIMAAHSTPTMMGTRWEWSVSWIVQSVLFTLIIGQSGLRRKGWISWLLGLFWFMWTEHCRHKTLDPHSTITKTIGRIERSNCGQQSVDDGWVRQAILSSLFSFYFVGGYDGTDYRDEILELVDGEWRHIATMNLPRYFHAVSVINCEDYLTLCH